MSSSCRSTSPPEPNQARPLWANEGHALLKTKTIMPPMISSTRQATPPSRRSTRVSDQKPVPPGAPALALPGRRGRRPGRRAAIPSFTDALSRDPGRALVQRHPVAGDQRLRLGAADELDEFFGGARRRAAADEVEVTATRVLARLGVAQRAGHTQVRDR